MCRRMHQTAFQMPKQQQYIVIHKQMETVQKKCATKVQEILLKSTESQAMFMAHIVEAMAEHVDMIL